MYTDTYKDSKTESSEFYLKIYIFDPLSERTKSYTLHLQKSTEWKDLKDRTNNNCEFTNKQRYTCVQGNNKDFLNSKECCTKEM